MVIELESREYSRNLTNSNKRTHNDKYYKELYDTSIRSFFWNAFRICAHNPG